MHMCHVINKCIIGLSTLLLYETGAYDIVKSFETDAYDGSILSPSLPRSIEGIRGEKGDVPA